MRLDDAKLRAALARWRRRWGKPHYFVNNAYGDCGHRHKTMQVAEKCRERMEHRHHREFGIFIRYKREYGKTTVGLVHRYSRWMTFHYATR
jgi:hypothetical protein